MAVTLLIGRLTMAEGSISEFFTIGRKWRQHSEAESFSHFFGVAIDVDALAVNRLYFDNWKDIADGAGKLLRFDGPKDISSQYPV